jgi:hypothetical protein
MPNLIYISINTDPTQRNEIYNFFPEEHQELRNAKVGQTINSRFFPATRMDDVIVGNSNAKYFIDDTKTIVNPSHHRVLIELQDYTLIIGAYFDEPSHKALFAEILSTFRFTDPSKASAKADNFLD